MNKNEIKKRIVSLLEGESEIEKIIIFGSFNNTETPNDIDIAVVQNSSENYLSLAMKYRKLTRSISKEIAIDIFPIIANKESLFFNKEISTGETIYARRN
ncbi:MAG: hypothetical protein WC055_16460 [Melioribacteraceae bacterium]